MKSKLLIIIGIFALLLFSSGCIRRTGIGPEAIEYHKGIKGLEINILKDLPPDEIWKDNPFAIGIELKNSGAFDINEELISVSGYDPKYIIVQESQRIFSLKGKQPGYPEGERMIMNFNAVNIAIPNGSDEYTGSFTINSKYSYETQVSVEVCINPNIYDIIKTNEICEIKTISLSGGQGAPVAITSIDETIAPKGIEYTVNFIMHVKNKGNGEVIKTLKIKEARLSGKNLECTEEIDFDNKKDNLIQCSTTLKGLRGAYVAPLTLKLEYDYLDKVDKKLKIIDVMLKSKKI